MTLTGRSPAITGRSATQIADSVRSLVERGELTDGASLPPVRTLAEQLGVNRNTVVAAYRHLAQAGVVISRGRGGTRVVGNAAVPQEGFAADTVLRDLGTGNPDPDLIPDLAPALSRVGVRPVLYGEPLIDPGLQDWAQEWMRQALGEERDFRLTVTGGASDAIERLLAQSLARDDAVAVEDPCFLATLSTVRLNGYRPVPVPVDAQGMTIEGLRAALEAGARAVVCTPRAQNPTGASLSADRARALRGVLAEYPYALVIEDDHFSLLSAQPYHSLIGEQHRRFALIRSVSKFLGPDMCLAVTASDPDTAARLALRLSPGTIWVSHLLQRLTHAQLSDPTVRAGIAEAGRHYAARNAHVATLLRAEGFAVRDGDGLSLWVPLLTDARTVGERLMRRGWFARAGDEFVLADTAASDHLRLTVHDLTDDEAHRLASDLSAAVRAALTQKAG